MEQNPIMDRDGPSGGDVVDTIFDEVSPERVIKELPRPCKGFRNRGMRPTIKMGAAI